MYFLTGYERSLLKLNGLYRCITWPAVSSFTHVLFSYFTLFQTSRNFENQFKVFATYFVQDISCIDSFGWQKLIHTLKKTHVDFRKYNAELSYQYENIIYLKGKTGITVL